MSVLLVLGLLLGLKHRSDVLGLGLECHALALQLHNQEIGRLLMTQQAQISLGPSRHVTTGTEVVT